MDWNPLNWTDILNHFPSNVNSKPYIPMRKCKWRTWMAQQKWRLDENPATQIPSTQTPHNKQEYHDHLDHRITTQG